MIELLAVDKTLIPTDCFIISWTNIKMIAGGAFSLGMITEYLISKLKQKK